MTATARSPAVSSPKEVQMKRNGWIRQFHRWLSIAFTVAVVVNIGALVLQTGGAWIGYLALLPLLPLLATGLYLFVQPYTARARGGQDVA